MQLYRSSLFTQT